MLLIVLVVLLLLALGGGVYGGGRGWGYAGWSPFGLLLVIVLILFLTGSFR